MLEISAGTWLCILHSQLLQQLLAIQESPHAGKVLRVFVMQHFMQERTAYLHHGMETPFLKESSTWLLFLLSGLLSALVL